MRTTVSTEQTPIVEHCLDVGRFTFYQNIIVAEIKEGVHATFENTAVAIQIATQLYGTETPIVYISHRINSYSFDPLSYVEVVNLFPNFKAFGIVTTNKRRRMLANLESIIFNKPIRIFDNIKNAMSWATLYLLEK